jgi:dTDP-4-amino-4,6-dideoxygalactose transaminase
MTGLAVLAVGATPVFADVAAATTFALDHADVEAKITERTRAVIAVPMWGYPADGPELTDACRGWGLPLIEDAAQAHATTVAGRNAGTAATIGTFSTHTRKLICTGEGGFCLTADDTLAARLRQLRNLGKPAGGIFGADFGLNYKLNALAAALGRTQLDRLSTRVQQRRAILGTIADIATELHGMDPFPIRPDGIPNGYAALITTDVPAQPVAGRLARAGITSDPHRYQYRPAYHSPAFAPYAPATRCRNAERLTTTIVTVPSHEGVGPAELARIAAALRG